MKRIVVIGTTGTGKTTLASRMATRLGYPHFELDAFFWEPKWTEAETPVFRERVAKALEGEFWVVDGNYTSRAIDLIWPRADTLVWLDYSLPVTIWRLVARTLRRVVTQEELWSGNRERLWTQLFTNQSLLLWALKSFGQHKRTFPILFSQPEYKHLTIVRHRFPSETQEWLDKITNGNGRSAQPHGAT